MMNMAAAHALADLISHEELSPDYIIPKAFDPRVGLPWPKPSPRPPGTQASPGSEPIETGNAVTPHYIKQEEFPMDASSTKSCKAGSRKFASASWRRSRPGASGTSEAASAWPTPWPFSAAVMRYDSQNPKWPDRDKLVCSRATPAWGVRHPGRQGLLPYEDLKTLNQPGTYLPSHCDKNKTPGVDMTTGSLGQGTSGRRHRPRRPAEGTGQPDLPAGRRRRERRGPGLGGRHVHSSQENHQPHLAGGRQQEAAGRLHPGRVPIFDLEAKFAAFGFDARRVDGNDIAQVMTPSPPPIGDKPRAIILDTVKGKGIREVEETMGNHSMTVAADVCDKWLAELRGELAGLE